ncbi:hypothetical protein O181_111075 [Austropuccinia psidii MF-1]|uniref:Uncharacterized protein n=1 Tax=Austropuccinia psidii MF-1 TaxID=1389203 RepID=A0A9Q3K1P2_9BASI|nr:hypothetical protein [Austropuccinia psidii MF-1]
MSNNPGASPSDSANNAETVDFVSFDPHVEREASLKTAFGEDKFDQVLKFDQELLKAEWEAYNHKVKLLEPIYKKRSEFLRKIPGFWLQVMTNDPQCNVHIDPIDRDALSHLEDLELEHDPTDARNVTFHFHFAKGNPYFSNRTLSKKFTVAETTPDEAVPNGKNSQKPHPLLLEMNQKYDLEQPVESKPVKIDWASEEHNLVAKKPWAAAQSMDDEDGDEDFTGVFGSLFNFFAAEDDRFGLHSHLLEVHSKALDLYAGLVEVNDEGGDDISDDEDDEDDDPNKVVDLESDSNDEPKKKKAKMSG